MSLENVYSEVFGILDVLGEGYISKIPTKLYNHIESSRNKNLKKVYSTDKSIDEQELSDEAVDFIAYLNLQYWVSEKEKKELLKIYRQNDMKKEEENLEKFNPDTVFKNFEIKQQDNYSNEIAVVNEDTWIKKVFKKIRNFFKK